MHTISDHNNINIIPVILSLPLHSLYSLSALSLPLHFLYSLSLTSGDANASIRRSISVPA